MKKTLKQLAKLGTMLSSFHWCYSVFILKNHNDDVDNIDYDDTWWQFWTVFMLWFADGRNLVIFQVGNIPGSS